MSQETLTGEQVWEALIKEERFKKARLEPWAQEELKPFVYALPEILCDHLDEQVTFSKLTKALVLCMKNKIEHGIAANLVSKHNDIPLNEVSERLDFSFRVFREADDLLMTLPVFFKLTFRDLLLSQPSFFILLPDEKDVTDDELPHSLPNGWDA